MKFDLYGCMAVLPSLCWIQWGVINSAILCLNSQDIPTDYWWMIQDLAKNEGICEDPAPDVAYHFGSTAGRLLQETQFRHTANWATNLGRLIARLLLSSGTQLLEHSVCCKLTVTVSKTVQLRPGDLTNYAYSHVFTGSLWLRRNVSSPASLCILHFFCLIQVLNSCDSQRHHFTVGLHRRRPLPPTLGEQGVRSYSPSLLIAHTQEQV